MRQEVGLEHRGVVSSNPRFQVLGVNWAVAARLLPRWGPGFGSGPGRHWLTRRVLKWWLVALYLNHYHYDLKCTILLQYPINYFSDISK